MAETNKPVENEFQKARLLFEKGMAEYKNEQFSQVNLFLIYIKINL